MKKVCNSVLYIFVNDTDINNLSQISSSEKKRTTWGISELTSKTPAVFEKNAKKDGAGSYTEDKLSIVVDPLTDDEVFNFNEIPLVLFLTFTDGTELTWGSKNNPVVCSVSEKNDMHQLEFTKYSIS